MPACCARCAQASPQGVVCQVKVAGAHACSHCGGQLLPCLAAQLGRRFGLQASGRGRARQGEARLGLSSTAKGHEQKCNDVQACRHANTTAAQRAPAGRPAAAPGSSTRSGSAGWAARGWSCGMSPRCRAAAHRRGREGVWMGPGGREGPQRDARDDEHAQTTAGSKRSAPPSLVRTSIIMSGRKHRQSKPAPPA